MNKAFLEDLQRALKIDPRDAIVLGTTVGDNRRRLQLYIAEKLWVPRSSGALSSYSRIRSSDNERMA